MACAANLRTVCTNPNMVVVGPETARVLRKAARRAQKVPDATVCATAGWSEKYQVTMGQGPMRDYLIKLQVPRKRIETPIATAFNTDGEMQKLVELLLDLEVEDDCIVDLVCRWWHLPRAYLNLRARLGPSLTDTVRINAIPVWMSFDLLGMAIEPGAWIKNRRILMQAF